MTSTSQVYMFKSLNVFQAAITVMHFLFLLLLLLVSLLLCFLIFILYMY